MGVRTSVWVEWLRPDKRMGRVGRKFNENKRFSVKMIEAVGFKIMIDRSPYKRIDQ
jgi:hypothetical protein